MRFVSAATIFLAFCIPALGQESTKTFTYTKTKQADLEIVVHYPPGWRETDKRPGIVFFFGGGWEAGSIKQFEPQAQYLASRGTVAARADYRVKSRHGVTPKECVDDGRAALRWFRQNADKLGVDPDKIVASGGSSGGHIAACTTLMPAAEGKDEKVSCKANALLLFNPALRFDFLAKVDNDKELAKAISPVLYLTKDSPPTLLFFGTDDFLFDHAKQFMQRAKELGHRSEIFTAEKQPHGFFNKSPWKEKTLLRADEFLVSLGYLQGRATIKIPDGKDEKPKGKDAPAKGTKAIRDLEYAKVGDVRLALDLQLPTEGAGPFPVVVAIHGGGWAAGKKEEAQGIRQANRGYAVATISYRLSNVAQFPAQIEDCKAAVRWLRANAKKYNLDAERVGATGHSAGGHLASMLGTTGSVKDFDKGDNLEFSSRVQAVCALSGPTDFLQMDAHALKDAKLKHDFPGSPESRLIGGPIQKNKEKVSKANPITYVSKESPPFLLIHGDQDPLVPVSCFTML